jgi:hypothetical protein
MYIIFECIIFEYSMYIMFEYEAAEVRQGVYQLYMLRVTLALNVLAYEWSDVRTWWKVQCSLATITKVAWLVATTTYYRCMQH